jgi:glucose/mannose transport system permease protein
LVFIVPTAALGLLLAYGLDLSGQAEVLFRPLFLYPMALSFVVTGTVWAWMYDPDAGVINNLLKGIGLGNLAQPWIADPQEATFCLIVAAIWQYTGFAMTLYLAAIRDISREIIEAAKVDGASTFQLFLYIIRLM